MMFVNYENITKSTAISYVELAEREEKQIKSSLPPVTGTLWGLARKAAAKASSASAEISPAVVPAQPCLGISARGAAGKELGRGRKFCSWANLRTNGPMAGVGQRKIKQRSTVGFGALQIFTC